MDNNYLMEWARRATEAYRRVARQVKGAFTGPQTPRPDVPPRTYRPPSRIDQGQTNWRKPKQQPAGYDPGTQAQFTGQPGGAQYAPQGYGPNMPSRVRPDRKTKNKPGTRPGWAGGN